MSDTVTTADYEIRCPVCTRLQTDMWEVDLSAGDSYECQHCEAKIVIVEVESIRYVTWRSPAPEEDRKP